MAPRRNPRFRLSRGQALTTSLALTLIGALLQWASIDWSMPLLGGFASVLIPLGVVSFITEYFLKAAYQEDLLDLVGLSHRLEEVGIENVSSDERVDWASLYSTSSVIRVLLIRPGTWQERDWNAVMTAAQDHTTEVSVYLPDPDTSARQVAEALSLDPDAYVASVRQNATLIEERWKNCRDESKTLHAGSTLTVEFVTHPPAYTLIQVDSIGMLLLQSPMSPVVGSPVLSVSFDLRRGRYIQQWFTDRWREITASTSGAPAFTDRRTVRGEGR